MSYFINSKNIKELKSFDFDDKYVDRLKNKETCVILFYAPWCIHCKNVAPIWEKLASRLPFYKIYAFDCVANAGHLDKIKTDKPDMISGFPTIYFYKNGIPIEKYEDERSEQKLMKKIMSM
jgi:thiol-disulfide isomerase/thioredoxin